MKNLATTLSPTLILLLGSIGTSWSNDFLKGLNAYHSGDFTRALSEWTPLAEQGHSPSQYNLVFLSYPLNIKSILSNFLSKGFIDKM
jgi:hypothetical protein